jgi:tRNA threonylcarbamoyladenosine biosynthesis protein TsaE
MTELERTTSDESQTHALGVALGQRLRAGDIVELIGELGAGKTRLVRGIAQGAGHDPDEVSSPTYVLMSEHRTPGATPILHIDAYRIAGAEELRDAGYDHAAPGALVLIEWADRLEGALDAGAAQGVLRIELEHAPDPADTARTFRFTGPRPILDRIAPAIAAHGAP